MVTIIEGIKILGSLFIMGLILGGVICVMWFCFVMVMNFYGIYIKNKCKKCPLNGQKLNNNFWNCEDCKGIK